MKMKKRITSLFLALAIVMGLAVPAWAADDEQIVLNQIQEEIDAKKELIFSSVYEQLKAQDALNMMDLYIEILSPEIEFSVQNRYNPESCHFQDSVMPYSFIRKCLFTYGGLVSFKYRNSQTEVVRTYMDFENTYYYILDSESSGGVVLSDILISILGYIPVVGTFTNILCAIQSEADRNTKNDIKQAGGYAFIVNTYDPISNSQSSVLLAWDDYPYAIIDYDVCENVKTEFFPETHPFENN